MSVTAADYHTLMDGFVRDLASLGQDLVSVYVYGSVARGNVRPGTSDVGDAYVFLRQRVLEDREAFLSAMRTMTEACRAMARSGLPAHAHHYYGDQELRYVPAGFLCSWGVHHLDIYPLASQTLGRRQRVLHRVSGRNDRCVPALPLHVRHPQGHRLLLLRHGAVSGGWFLDRRFVEDLVPALSPAAASLAEPLPRS